MFNAFCNLKCVCVCVCVCACVRACVRACVCVCVSLSFADLEDANYILTIAVGVLGGILAVIVVTVVFIAVVKR